MSFSDRKGRKPEQISTFNFVFKPFGELNSKTKSIIEHKYNMNIDEFEEQACDRKDVINKLKPIFNYKYTTWVTFNG